MAGFYRGDLAWFLLPHASFFLLYTTAHLASVKHCIRATAAMHHPKDFSLKSGDLTAFPTLCAIGELGGAEHLSLCFCSSSKEHGFYLSMSWVTRCIHTIPLQPLSPKRSLAHTLVWTQTLVPGISLSREMKQSAGHGSSAPSRQPGPLHDMYNKDSITYVSWKGCSKPTSFGWIACWYHPSHLQYPWCYCKCCYMAEGITHTVASWKLSTRWVAGSPEFQQLTCE